MKKLTKKEQQAIAEKIFANNKEFKTLYVCEDGNAFSVESSAKSHCNREKIEYNEFSSAKEVAAKSAEANKLKKDASAKTDTGVKAGKGKKTDETEVMSEEEAQAKLQAVSDEELEMKTVVELQQLVFALNIMDVKAKDKAAILEALLAKKAELTNSNEE